MKIVDAVWEKRNLGVETVEVACSNEDSVDELKETLERIKAPYSVVKVPSVCTQLLFEVQKAGYFFVETGIEICGDINKVETPRIYSRFIPHIKMERADGKVLDYILDEIKKGEIYATDRIAIDPYFSREIAGQRYYNWANDLLENDAFMAVLYYNDNPVAFNLIKETGNNDKMLDSVLAGLLPGTNGGMGFLLVYAENELCKMKQKKYCIGRVSSNNLSILRLHLQYGYEIKSMSYVLTKHQ